MKLNPYLHFNGNCEEALEFYAQHLDIQVDFKMTFGEMPNKDIPEAWHSKIMHCEWRLEDNMLMACDPPPSMYSKPESFFINMSFDTIEQAEAAYEGLSKDGKIIMAMEETFYSHRFAMFRDRFDIPWMINCLKENQ